MIYRTTQIVNAGADAGKLIVKMRTCDDMLHGIGQAGK
jgi:hypothetical protein